MRSATGSAERLTPQIWLTTASLLNAAFELSPVPDESTD
jgi:hypothetical protein